MGFFGDLGAGLASSGAGFGLNYASMLLSAETQRDLRRTAYQDQMHSMKEAGLNPILAYGGTPGAGQSSLSMHNPEDPITSASQFASQREGRSLAQAQSTSAKAMARKAKAEAETAEAIRDAQVAAMRAKGTRDQAEADFTSGARTDLTHAQKERAWQSRNLDFERTTSERALRLARKWMIEAQAGASEASAAERHARATSIERDMPEYIAGEEGGKVIRGAERAVGILGDAMPSVRTLRTLRNFAKPKRKRETRTSAKEVQKSERPLEYRYWKDEDRADYDRPALPEGRRYWRVD